MNKARLTALCHKIREETGLTFNSVMLYYFLESVLKKLVQGKYGENLVFKGGFLLSNVVGIESRSTMDIDLLLRNTHVSEEKISELLTESLKEKREIEPNISIMISHTFEKLCPKGSSPLRYLEDSKVLVK